MKIKPFSVFIIMIFMTLHICLSITAIYNYNCQEAERASRILCDENSITFIPSKTDFTASALKENLPNDSVVFSVMSENRNVRGIYYKGSFSKLEMKSGRFFEKNDFTGQKRLAVVGSDVPVKSTGKKQYIEYKDEEYEVIGKIGYLMPTKLDRTVFLTLNDSLVGENVKEYIISGKKKQEKFDYLGDVGLFGEILVFDNHELDLFHVVSTSKAKDITVVILFICMIFHIYVVLHFLIEKEKPIYYIKSINGYTIWQIKKSELAKFLLLNVVISAFDVILLFFMAGKRLVIHKPILLKSSIIYMAIAGGIFYFMLNKELKHLKFGRRNW